MKFITSTSFFFLFIFLFVLPFAFAELMVGFYGSSCPRAEAIIREVVERIFNTEDKSIPAALLRLHFHDCFVRGCDASILLETQRGGNETEKNAPANKSVRGYRLIDEAKREVERECPSTVSCADIIALATRDAVSLSRGPHYDVPTGRRDGIISKASEVNLPGPQLSVSQAFQVFRSKGMTMEEMVVLLGAHTVGFTHCNFVGGFKNHPTMDPSLRAGLIRLCGNTTMKNPSVFLDQSTPFVFDNQFYRQMEKNRGVLFLDQQLAMDPASERFVADFARNNVLFINKFVNAIIKMGNIGVLVGNAGQIRRNCRLVNS